MLSTFVDEQFLNKLLKIGEKVWLIELFFEHRKSAAIDTFNYDLHRKGCSLVQLFAQITRCVLAQYQCGKNQTDSV